MGADPGRHQWRQTLASAPPRNQALQRQALEQGEYRNAFPAGEEKALCSCCHGEVVPEMRSGSGLVPFTIC